MIGKFAITSVFLFLMWVALAGAHPQELFFGAAAAIMVSAFVTVYYFSTPLLKLRHIASLRLLKFIPIFLYNEIKAHLKMVAIIYSPRLRIDPAMIEIPVYLKKDMGITATATAITLLPGTFTVHADKKKLLVHTISNTDAAVASSKRIEQQFGEVFT